jgi:hypothetical protein
VRKRQETKPLSGLLLKYLSYIPSSPRRGGAFLQANTYLFDATVSDHHPREGQRVVRAGINPSAGRLATAGSGWV